MLQIGSIAKKPPNEHFQWTTLFASCVGKKEGSYYYTKISKLASVKRRKIKIDWEKTTTCNLDVGGKCIYNALDFNFWLTFETFLLFLMKHSI